MPTEVRLGIIGAGRIGQIHAENIFTRVRGTEVVCVADVDMGRATELVQKCGGAKIYRDFNEMLEKEDIDAVLICASTSIHREAIVKAAEKKRHIFCEKPLALTLEETDDALAAVGKSEVFMQIGFMRRFDPAISSAKKEIEKGTIGEPFLFKVTSRDPQGPPLDYVKVSGGLFIDSAIHDIDIARWFMGEVKSVFARGETLIYPEYKKYGDVDVAFTTLNFKNDALGSIENSRKSGYGYDNRMEVAGTKGTLQIGYVRGKHFLLLNESGVSQDTIPSWKDRFGEAFVHEMQHFVSCIINNSSPLVTGTDARKALEIALAATQSCKQGDPVALP